MMWTQSYHSGQANKFKGSKLKYSDPCRHGMAVIQSRWKHGGGGGRGVGTSTTSTFWVRMIVPDLSPEKSLNTTS